MSREILDCLKRERDICVKNVIHRQNTAFMNTAFNYQRGTWTEICTPRKSLTELLPRRHARGQTEIIILTILYSPFSFSSWVITTPFPFRLIFMP